MSVSDFASIEDQALLIFHNPERLVPLSGNEWTSAQLDQLKVIFEDVDLQTFLRDAALPDLKISVCGAAFVERFDSLENLFIENTLPYTRTRYCNTRFAKPCSQRGSTQITSPSSTTL